MTYGVPATGAPAWRAATAVEPAAPRRTPLHRPAPGLGTVDEVARPRVVVGHRAPARGSPRRVPEDLRALQAGAAAAHEMWSVLETLTPSEYMEFRGNPRAFVGIPVAAVPHDRIPAGQQERRHAARVRARHRRTGRAARCARSAEPVRRGAALPGAPGYPRPRATWNATGRHRTRSRPDLVPVFEKVYEDARGNWDAYHLCEDLVDIETQFQPGDSATCAR